MFPKAKTKSGEIGSGRTQSSSYSSRRREVQDRLRKWRKGIRRAYVGILLVGLIVSFYFAFISMPNLSVHRVHLSSSKYRNYARKHLYGENRTYGLYVDLENQNNEAAAKGLYKQLGIHFVGDGPRPYAGFESRSVACPCTKTTLSWTEFTHFYYVTYAHPDRPPYVKYLFPPELEGKLGGVETDAVDTVDPQYIFRAPMFLRSYEKFCNLVNNVPADLLIVQSQVVDCRDFINVMISSTVEGVTSRWKDSRASFFESPVLLPQKVFYSNTLSLLHNYLSHKQALMLSSSTTSSENSLNRDMYITGLTNIWMHVLESFADNSSCSDVDFFTAGADKTREEFGEQLTYYPYHFAIMLEEGQTFLGMNMNWTEYYHACRPTYCDIMDSSGNLRRTVATIALLGGVATCFLLLAHLLLWPIVDAAIVYLCVGDTEPTAASNENKLPQPLRSARAQDTI